MSVPIFTKYVGVIRFFTALSLLLLFVAPQAWTRTAMPEPVDSILTIPASFRSVKPMQFADRNDFHTLRFEKGSQLREIGNRAFMGCRSLRNVTLPSSLALLGEGAFSECPALRQIEIPAKVTKLPKHLFSWCDSLQTVSLPARLTAIGSHAFAYCSSLTDVKIPRSITAIGTCAFAFCTSLREIHLPSSLRELESYAFAECSSLQKATLPPNNALLGELIFSGCRNLRELTVLSPTPPPFDCNSQPFEDNEAWLYGSCRLITRPEAAPLFAKASGWRNFNKPPVGE